MIIDCISDLHGQTPELPGGDVLIIAGDLLSHGGLIEQFHFDRWLEVQDYKHKIIVAGNHDNFIRDDGFVVNNFRQYNVDYLEDSGCVIEGIKFWGSPWSLLFNGIHPQCKAFTGSESALKKHWDLIPDDTQVLITHGPAFGILDLLENGDNAGSKTLTERIDHLKNLRVHICGHIHEARGSYINPTHVKFINASMVDRRYKKDDKQYERIIWTG